MHIYYLSKKIRERFHVFIMTFLILLISSVVTLAQITVTGKVTGGPTNESLPGVNILVKGTATGTSTNVEGEFSLSAPATATLTVSFIGYEPQEIPVNGRTKINITLKEDSKSLSEVVVIGYGTSKRANLTGAAASISSKDIEERPVSRLENVLAGQLPGVDVQTTTGEPGAALQIRVRGTGSLNASNDPLYVVDGVPVETLNGINPSDVQTIDVLKDASSAAIYGSRGSNGVVIITTKRGVKGKPRIQFNMTQGVSKVEGRIDMMSPEQWIEQRKEGVDAAWVSRGVTLKKPYTASDPMAFRASELGISLNNPNTSLMYDPKWAYGTDSLDYVDWQDAFFGNTGTISNYQLSVNGGSDNVTYNINGSYMDQKGVIINTNYKRATVRANIDAQVNKFIKVGLTLSPSIEWINGGGQVDGKDRQGMNAVQMPPVAPLGTGYYVGAQPNGTYPWSGRYISPIAVLERTQIDQTRNRLNTNIYLHATLARGLQLQLTGGMDNNNSISNSFTPTNAIRDWATVPYAGYASTSDRQNTNDYRYLFQSTLNYNRTFGKHSVTALLGYSVERTNGYGNRQNNTRLPNDWTNLFNQGSSTVGITSISQDKTALISYFGRVQYDYKEKYLFSASLRRDGSSKFGSDNRWGTFPAVSAAWRVSSESFMQGIQNISDLKLRASFGITGNNRIPNNAQFSLLANSDYALNGAQQTGYAPSGFENTQLGWEQTSSYNFGADFGLFKNRLVVAADYYVRRTSELLLQAPVSSLTGFTRSWQNIGDIENKGFELSLNSRNTTGVFKWGTNLNVSYNQNRVIKLGYDNTPIPAGFSGLTSMIEVGQPIGYFKLYDAIGVYENQADVDGSPIMSKTIVGDSKYRDVNGDNKIDENDRTKVGQPLPAFVYGFTNNFSYRNFDLNILLTAQTGGMIYSMIGRSIDRPGMGYLYNKLAKWENRWKSPEDPGDGMTPSINATTGSYYDTRWLYSSDYIRLKNITFGYNVPKMKWFERARIYVSVENPYIWHKYDGGYTPEAANNEGGDYGGYPQSRTYSIGINLNL
ncbi:SusC/RagA family TonB-linked outer membrane protein [Dyadobacter psychrotolerans]|uniref:TonB-dependent receptor n=1 Tax=Dyadobacter psychrotolerans TaxID=2541721 RepID=A0A4R5DQT2_9BACT|nr:TonB-dependent receptor [Dyadobacter psychrotolerans]TDE16649.1 TonB-dependent receptor [Dyadobacter psychrotolerans]